ncbi:hypothetical protein ABZ484_22950 [Streptomyces sp. NPDC006393]|uniref:hypothetical protein n=1 Tax=Streptomyces sp. NPDC006393 TaxID=3156763 RepID=UPI003411EB43
MTSRAGEPFALDRALRDVDGLLAADVPAHGPTTSEDDPVRGEWSVTRGEGFVLVPLWESVSLVGVYAPEWNTAEETAHAHLAALAGALDRRWGAHRPVGMRVPLFRRIAGEPMPPFFEALCAQDLLGDLAVWGPPQAGPGRGDRWLAVSVNQSDGDAPFVLAAAVTDHPIVELEDG